MARTKISEFSATAADNTDIDNINIAEGCAPSGINNAIRELMAQLKDMQTGASGDTFTLTTVNSTTVDTTNLEATNLKAKDGTAAGSIANSTGVVTLASTVLTTTDINGGTVDGTTIGATTPSTVVATQVDITAQGDLRLQDTTGGQFVALQAPGTIATSYTLTLPVDDGTSGQALITDGSGVLSWSSAASGDVYGPASATDNAVARYDGTTGKIIQNSAVTIADDGATVIAANSTTDGLRITQLGTGNALTVEDSTNPDATPFVINASGIVTVGGTPVIGISYPQFQVTGFGDGSIGNNAASISLNGFLPSGGGHKIDFNRSNSATVNTNTIVANNDQLGLIRWGGADGTNYIRAAQIAAEVDGTPGTNDMPGRLVFYTTADGASSSTERMRIGNDGTVGIGAANTVGRNLIIGKNITGGATSLGINVNGVTQSDVTSEARYIQSFFGTAAASFTLSNASHFFATQGTIGLGSTVTNQYGFNATSSLTGATNNYGFYGNIASGTGRWNFYAAGTADNYFAGNVGIGSNVITANLDINTANATFRIRNASAGNDFSIKTVAGPITQAGSVSNTDLAFITNDVERMRVSSTGVVTMGSTPGASSLRVTPVASAVNYWDFYGRAAGSAPYVQAAGSDTNIDLLYSAKGTGAHVFYSAGGSFTPQFRIAHTASAVDYLQVTGAATGNNVSFSAAGTDENIGIDFSSKGSGSLRFFTGGNRQFSIANTASAVNYLQVTGAATGAAATLSAQGSDTNIDLRLTPKGTGVLRFGTYTAGILAQAGYITIKDAAGNTRNLLVG
jgi:hypothetical protein